MQHTRGCKHARTCARGQAHTHLEFIDPAMKLGNVIRAVVTTEHEEAVDVKLVSVLRAEDVPGATNKSLAYQMTPAGGRQVQEN